VPSVPVSVYLCCVPIRPLLLVAALAGGDYLLWTWSSAGHSTTLALISGLALAPLILALLWLVALTAARLLLMRSASTDALSPQRKQRALRRLAASRRRQAPSQQASGGWEDSAREPSSARRSSEKIAA
jgi:hypothetical protein